MERKEILFLTILPLIFFFNSVLVGGRIFANGDSLLQFYPYSYYLGNQFSHSWCQDILTGFPLFVTLTGIFFHPLRYLGNNFLTPILFYNYLTVLNFFLAAFFTYLLARNLKLSRVSSLIITFTYTFSQWCIHWGSIIVNSNYFFILPCLFLSILKISQKRYWYILLGGIALGLGWLTGHAQLVFYIALSGLLYAIFLDLLNYQKEKPFYRNIYAFKSLLVIFLISFLIGLPQLLSSFKFNFLTNRKLGLSYQEATIGAICPFDLTRYFLPYFSLPFSSSESLLYIGFLPLFFALMSLIYKKKDKQILFFIGLFLFSFFSSIKYSPLFWLLHQLPFLKFFRVPSRWMYIGSFALAVLAGYGFEYVCQNKKKTGFLIKWFRYILYLATIIIIIGNIIFWVFKKRLIYLLCSYFDTHLYQKTTKLPLEYYHHLIQTHITNVFSNIDIFNYKFLIPFAFILLGYWLIKLYYLDKINLIKFKYLSLSIVILNFLLVYQGCYGYISVKQYLSKPSTVEFITNKEKDLSSFRIFSFMPGFSEYQKLIVPYNPSVQQIFAFQSAMIVPNLNILYNLQSIDGYDNFMPRRNARVLAELGSDRATSGNKLTDKKIKLEKKIEEFLSKINLLSMMNVKYIISAYQLNSVKLKKVFHTEVTPYKIPIYVYENLEVMPRVYFVNQANFIESNEEKNLRLLLNPKIDFHKVTFIECPDCYQEKKRTASGKISIIKYQPGLLELEVNTDSSKWLVFGESNLPGWVANIDDKPAKIYTANYLFQAIKVPAGHHCIIFKYKPSELIK
ncbi:hypothetical protein DRN69_00760 [Candidatus Pacearchaeota archaeon]|nr:MAG: hypothetical protein DRN69_00760 [Candidatus Pacearchaeota archaeon]